MNHSNFTPCCSRNHWRFLPCKSTSSCFKNVEYHIISPPQRSSFFRTPRSRYLRTFDLAVTPNRNRTMFGWKQYFCHSMALENKGKLYIFDLNHLTDSMAPFTLANISDGTQVACCLAEISRANGQVPRGDVTDEGGTCCLSCYKL